MRPTSLRRAAPLLLAALLAACGQTVSFTLPGMPHPTEPSGYSLLYSPAPWAFAFVGAPEPVRRGYLSERYELRDGDCGGSDCGAFRARAEMAQDKEASPARLDQDIWYGWSFLNASIPTVTRATWLGTVVGEWKIAGEDPAIFRFIQVPEEDLHFASCDPAVCTQGGAPGEDVVVELDALSQVAGWGQGQNDGRICRLWAMQANAGKWVDVVVNTNFGTDRYGYLRVWVNGELKCNYLGPLVPPSSVRAGLPPTNRRGIFESFTRRWTEAQGATPKPTLVAYYDEALWGRSRAEVDVRLMEAQGARPVD